MIKAEMKRRAFDALSESRVQLGPVLSQMASCLGKFNRIENDDGEEIPEEIIEDFDNYLNYVRIHISTLQNYMGELYKHTIGDL